MSVQTAINIIENELKMLDNGGHNSMVVHFMGGEPFLNFEVIRSVCEWVCANNLESKIMLSATTNGTLIGKNKNWLRDNCDIFKLVLSTDGDKVMQDTNRSNSSVSIDYDFYVKTWPYGKVKMTISPHTIGRLAEGVKYLHSIGISRIDANLALGKGMEWNTTFMREYKYQLRMLIPFYLHNPDLKPVSMLNIDITKILDYKSLAKRCGCGEYLVCYDTDGKVYPCHLFAPITLNSNQVRECEEINFKDKSIFVSEKCQLCALHNVCATCPGMNYQYSQSVENVPDVFCYASRIEFHYSCLLLHNRLLRGQDVGNKDIIKKSLTHYNKILNTIKP